MLIKNYVCALGLIFCIVSCSSDDDTTDTSFLIGSEYIYRAPDCENDDPLGNTCFASIEFLDEEEVGILPFGDAIYNVIYKVEGDQVIVLYSDFFVNGIDQVFDIESEEVLIDQNLGFRYVRE